MSTTSENAAVQVQIEVDVPVDHAFRVFTTEFDRVKPRDHNLRDVDIAETVFETHVGGAVYDRGVDGNVCRWARVLQFEPPTRFVISWDISPRWELETDPGRCSEVEVTFTALTPARTLVRLEHRHLDRHGIDWEAERDSIAGDQGWPLYLERFTAVAAES